MDVRFLFACSQDYALYMQGIQTALGQIRPSTDHKTYRFALEALLRPDLLSATGSAQQAERSDSPRQLTLSDSHRSLLAPVLPFFSVTLTNEIARKCFDMALESEVEDINYGERLEQAVPHFNGLLADDEIVEKSFEPPTKRRRIEAPEEHQERKENTNHVDNQEVLNRKKEQAYLERLKTKLKDPSNRKLFTRDQIINCIQKKPGSAELLFQYLEVVCKISHRDYDAMVYLNAGGIRSLMLSMPLLRPQLTSWSLMLLMLDPEFGAEYCKEIMNDKPLLSRLQGDHLICVFQHQPSDILSMLRRYPDLITNLCGAMPRILRYCDIATFKILLEFKEVRDALEGRILADVMLNSPTPDHMQAIFSHQDLQSKMDLSVCLQLSICASDVTFRSFLDAYFKEGLSMDYLTRVLMHDCGNPPNAEMLRVHFSKEVLEQDRIQLRDFLTEALRNPSSIDWNFKNSFAAWTSCSDGELKILGNCNAFSSEYVNLLFALGNFQTRKNQYTVFIDPSKDFLSRDLLESILLAAYPDMVDFLLKSPDVRALLDDRLLYFLIIEGNSSLVDALILYNDLWERIEPNLEDIAMFADSANLKAIMKYRLRGHQHIFQKNLHLIPPSNRAALQSVLEKATGF